VRQIIIMANMLARPHAILLLVAASLVVLTPPGLIEAQLVNGFYASHGCPKAESIIKSAVITAIQQNSANAPGLLRIFFHDCIVNVRVQKNCNSSWCMLLLNLGFLGLLHPSLEAALDLNMLSGCNLC
jgi:hypothetical protein